MTLDELVEKGKKLYRKVHKPLKLGLAGLTLATNLYATDTLQVDVNQPNGEKAQAQTQLEVNGENYTGTTNEKGIATITGNFTNQTPIQEETRNQPDKFKLEPAYPNPGNDTQIDFHLQKQGKTTINIYNIKGQKLKTWQKNYTPGEHSTKINMNTPNGIYLIQTIGPSGKTQTTKYTHIGGNQSGNIHIQPTTPNKNNQTRQTQPTLAKIANENGTITIKPENKTLKDTTYQTQLQEGMNKEQIQLQQKPPIEKTIQFIRLFKDHHGGTNKGFMDPTSGVHATIQDSTYISGKDGKIHLKLKPNITSQDSILITKPSQDSVFLDQKFPITWLKPSEEGTRKQMTVEDPYGPNKWDKIKHWDNILERTIYMTGADLADGELLQWYNKEKGEKMDSIPYYIQDEVNYEGESYEFHYEPAIDSVVQILNNKIKKHAGANHDQLRLLTKTQDSSYAAKHGATFNLEAGNSWITKYGGVDEIPIENTQKNMEYLQNATVYLPGGLRTPKEGEDILGTETKNDLLHELSRVLKIRSISANPEENMAYGELPPKPREYMTKHFAMNYQHNLLNYFNNYEEMAQEVDSLRNTR